MLKLARKFINQRFHNLYFKILDKCSHLKIENRPRRVIMLFFYLIKAGVEIEASGVSLLLPASKIIAGFRGLEGKGDQLFDQHKKNANVF